ncbi:L-glyceraldehyde 3-phosphate reductase [Marinilongibacter aquaticus]|uniref:L-glyceraldehyde 3-phosphate reductase n=1 Tax=Marinilongibacter aquaticus TaxID=2975157 RepID=UPI0021BD94A8|nr:L-glyceraldehyde 3-phosphate reductase [Marinilongibacter aquaticus]UBM60919.1 L-glyceraldehyde 3-phosphate reductase [Marinilongibacter aquaticus]
MTYVANASRYDKMSYRRCGNSGVMLPEISLGLWHNFGGVDTFETYRAILREAFNAGVTHFDLANNYGPPPGSAEENFGHILKKDFLPYRDELIISSKAGYRMWPGPYGEWGSRKYLIASCNASLKRMGLDYVDIFYSHRPDPNTPLEETMGALDQIVRSGKAIYAGLSNYDPEQTAQAVAILKDLGTPCLIHQPKYSMLVREPENGLLDILGKEGIGCIPFSPLAQGLLTNKYLKGIPEGSRAALDHGFLQKDEVNDKVIDRMRRLNALAESRGQSLAQMAIAWLLKDERVTTVLIGASRVSQLHNSLGALENKAFSTEELSQIEDILAS